MRLQDICLPLLIFGAVLIPTLEARRIRVRPQEQEEEDYYEGDPQEEEQRVVYISSADQYNGLYGQPSSSPRTSQDNYIPRGSSSASKSAVSSKVKEKAPPVQTIRNYNKVNDDGSFTFGYEAADGSFKEETRGTDCVVRGKYGYVDPDGNKREFTYVSGNPCDPNAPKEEESEDKSEQDSNEPDNFPANYPTRPIRPIARPATPAPKPVTLFHNTYQQEEEEQPAPEQVLKQQPHQQPARAGRPEYIRPQYVDVEQEIYRPRLVPVIASSTPASVIYKQTETPLTITPRPFTHSTQRPKQSATTYRPQLVQVVTPRPQILYTKSQRGPSTYPSSTPSSLGPTRSNLDFDAEFQKFQTEHNIVSPTPKTLGKATTSKYVKPTNVAPSPTPGGGQVYSSELIYDPASGQYKTQLYQALPQSEGDFSLSQRIQPYVHQPQQQVLNFKQLQQQSPLYRQVTARPVVQPVQHIQPNQALYQQQQAELQFQNSAQLYAQQQRSRQQQQQHHHQQPQPQPATPQQIYYIQPVAQHQGGQIEAFLRGHNIQF